VNDRKLDGVAQLMSVMDALRNPQSGCPWDLEQDFSSLTKYTLEETYELIEAIDNNDVGDIKEELGDLLFHIIFYAKVAEESQLFNLNELAQEAATKLTRRHPHVFADKEFSNEKEFKKFWESEKAKERQSKASANFFANIPQSMPSLLRASKIQKRVASVGFDWPEMSGVFDKIDEELLELKNEVKSNNYPLQLEEFGDLLFAVVNLGRHLKIDSELALHQANKKFVNRFTQVEQKIREGNMSLSEASLEQMEAAWQSVKQQEKLS